MQGLKTSYAFIFLSLNMFVASLSAVTLNKTDQPAGLDSNYKEQIKENLSTEKSSEKFNFSQVPKSGQKVSYAKGDDGNLKFGKPWPEPRFADNGDGTVMDLLTGLMWTKNADQAKGRLDWEEAVSRCSACRDGNYTDWRLPNRKEFESILDLGRYHPSLPAGHPFLNVKSDYYWTSTTPANNEDHGWVVHFYIGFITHDDKAGTHYLWCVRSNK